MTFRVVVGNVGTVYYGPSSKDAVQAWNDYVYLSRTNQGRAAGESVLILRDDNITREYEGTNPSE